MEFTSWHFLNPDYIIYTRRPYLLKDERYCASYLKECSKTVIPRRAKVQTYSASLGVLALIFYF